MSANKTLAKLIEIDLGLQFPIVSYCSRLCYIEGIQNRVYLRVASEVFVLVCMIIQNAAFPGQCRIKMGHQWVVERVQRISQISRQGIKTNPGGHRIGFERLADMHIGGLQ